MTAKQILKKTKPYIIAKLLLGGATVLASAVLLAICLGLGWLFGEGGMAFMIFVWIGGTGVIRFAIMHYMGYMVKAGHIAVIAEALANGRFPKDQIAFGKARVTKRFATSNVYFTVDKLVSGAVKQIQSVAEKAGNALDFIPGMKAVTGAAQLFISIYLGYIDECCLGWTFLQKDQNAYKSAADGVVIYAMNWKALLKDAAKTMAKVIGISALVLLAVFVPVGLIFKLLSWSPLLAFLLALLIAWTVKFALLDSYIMIQVMTSYMHAAKETEITFDLYGQICSVSSKFKELLAKGMPGRSVPQQEYAPQEDGEGAGQGYDGAQGEYQPEQREYQPEQREYRPEQRPYEPVRQEIPAARPVFCRECGAKNVRGDEVCHACGAPLN